MSTRSTTRTTKDYALPPALRKALHPCALRCGRMTTKTWCRFCASTKAVRATTGALLMEVTMSFDDYSRTLSTDDGCAPGIRPVKVYGPDGTLLRTITSAELAARPSPFREKESPQTEKRAPLAYAKRGGGLREPEEF